MAGIGVHDSGTGVHDQRNIHSPRMVFENFVQYNSESKTISSNFRFRFIHRPLSDFFVLYTESRGVSGNDRLIRLLTVKFTHLLSF